MLVKVVAVQSHLGVELSLEDRLFIFKQRPDFVCLPEYFQIDESADDYSRAALRVKENLEYLQNLSESFSTCLIGGSIVEADNYALYNSSYIFNRGTMLGRYRKLNPMAGEIRRGILPGDKFFITEVEGVRIGVLICADVLNADLFEAINAEDVDIIFIPTTSPFREGEGKREKQRRDKEIFQTGAQKASSYIVKTCGVGSLFGKELQGRSLIVSPWSIVKRVDIFSEASRCILTAVLNIDEIREFRQHQKIARIVRA